LSGEFRRRQGGAVVDLLCRFGERREREREREVLSTVKKE
jgi:hypothetical protein